MNQRRVLVLTDGAATSSQAVQVLLDGAGPPSVTSITCLLLDPSTGNGIMPLPALLGLPEIAFAGGCSVMFVDGPSMTAVDQTRRAVAVLDELQIRASVRGLLFNGEYSPKLGEEAIVDYSARFDVVVDCRPPRAKLSRNALNPVLRRLLSQGRQPVVLAHSGRGEIERVVLATRADRNLDDLCRWGGDCATRLNVPLAVLSAARTPRRLSCQLGLIESTLATLGLDARVSGFRSHPRELAARLNPTDLLIVKACARPWPLRRYLSADLEDLLVRAPCLTGILPERSCAGELARLVKGGVTRDNIESRVRGRRPFIENHCGSIRTTPCGKRS